MNIIKKLKLRESFQSIVSRFPVTFAFITALTIVAIYFICRERYIYGYVEALSLGLCSSFAIEAAFEHGKLKSKYTSIIPIVVSVILCVLLTKVDNVYLDMGVDGVSIMFLFIAAALLYREGTVSHIVKSAFIAGLFANIVFLGFFVCLMAFNHLIIEIDDLFKIVEILIALTSFLFFSIMFLPNIPKPEQEITVPKAYKVIIHKALFYIYLLLIGILYVYILKTIFVHKMPVGKFNWFGCFVLFFYVFFLISVDESDGIIQKYFKKYGAFFIYWNGILLEK